VPHTHTHTHTHTHEEVCPVSSEMSEHDAGLETEVSSNTGGERMWEETAMSEPESRDDLQVSGSDLS